MYVPANTKMLILTRSARLDNVCNFFMVNSFIKNFLRAASSKSEEQRADGDADDDELKYMILPFLTYTHIFMRAPDILFF